MGDPLGVAAGVAGLISLGIQISKGMVEFYISSTNKGETIAKTTDRLKNLLSTLENLDKALQGRQFRSDEVDQLTNVENSIESCRDVIEELQIELQKFKSPSGGGIQTAAKIAGRKLAYPFKESTLRKVDEDISEIRSNLLAALSVLQLKRGDDLQNDIADLTILVDLLRTTQMSGTIRDWLKAPDPTLNYNEACKRKHPRTGLWFVKGPIFDEWWHEDYSFLWMNGHSGCGKTVLSSTIIQHTLRRRRNNPRIGIVFHYFSFSDKSKQNVSGLLRTLALQLSDQLDDKFAALTDLHNTFKDNEAPLTALENTFKQLVAKFEDVYVIIDALDESPRGEERTAVLDSLSKIQGWLIRGLHLLVTSRDEVDIREQLGSQIKGEVRTNNSGIDQDIADYVTE
jgi:ankyrin repeat domain-containing protein 50